jgi:hypothetical protein
MITNNFQIAGLIQRLRRFRYETVKSASSGLADVNSHDFARAKSYLASAVAYIDWIVSQPQLDLPETTPTPYDLAEPETLDMPENEALVDLMRLYDLMEKEIGNSQSSRYGDGLISHDEKRMRAMLEKMNAFLDTYVSTIQPLDLPESAPLRGQTGPGRTGI